MNWLDIVLLIILAVSMFAGFRKGLSRVIIGLVSVILALLFGVWFYGTASSFLVRYLSSRAVANFAGFLMVFFGVLLLGTFVSWIVGKFLRVTGLSIFDHVLGAAFGLVRGVLIAVGLIMGLMAFSPGDKPPASVVDSKIAPYTVDAARAVVSMAPHELKDGFRKTYAQVKMAWSAALDNGIGPSGEKKKNEKRI